MPSSRKPVTPTSSQSRRARGSGRPCTAITGSSTSRAMISRALAKVAGGTSLTPILMQSHTLLHSRQVTHHTARTVRVEWSDMARQGSRSSAAGCRRPAGRSATVHV